MVENILHRNCVYYGNIELPNFVIKEDYAANKKCRLTTSNKLKEFTSTSFIYGFPKGNLLVTQDISHYTSLQWSASGVKDRIQKIYFPVTKECNVDAAPETKVRAVKLAELMTNFVILGIGICMSCLSFIIEMVDSFVIKSIYETFESDTSLNFHDDSYVKYSSL